MRVVRLKAIARWIGENLPELRAEVVEGYCNTDRHPKGVGWRIPGKGRRGNRLIVWRDKDKIIDHNAAQTYRNNKEVVRAMCRYFDGINPMDLLASKNRFPVQKGKGKAFLEFVGA